MFALVEGRAGRLSVVILVKGEEEFEYVWIIDV